MIMAFLTKKLKAIQRNDVLIFINNYKKILFNNFSIYIYINEIIY